MENVFEFTHLLYETTVHFYMANRDNPVFLFLVDAIDNLPIKVLFAIPLIGSMVEVLHWSSRFRTTFSLSLFMFSNVEFGSMVYSTQYYLPPYICRCSPFRPLAEWTKSTKQIPFCTAEYYNLLLAAADWL